MPGGDAGSDQVRFLGELLDARLLIATGAPGVYGRGQALEDVRERVAALITRAGEIDQPEQVRFPPVMPRHDLERAGYLKSFPHLAGTIFAFEGSESDADTQYERASRHQDWSEFQTMTDLVMTPAACYPVYPAIAARGPISDGLVVDAGGSYVFRREPSEEPTRLQMFHQREVVKIGIPEAVQSWREEWRERARILLAGLGLEVRLEVASDPFFGRGGRILAAGQREQQLKFELLTPIFAPQLTAVASFNYHQDHFAKAFGIVRDDGAEVHTACLGFGLERIALALFARHGLEVERWPQEVRAELW